MKGEESIHYMFLPCFSEYALIVLAPDFNKAVKFLSSNILIKKIHFLFEIVLNIMEFMKDPKKTSLCYFLWYPYYIF